MPLSILMSHSIISKFLGSADSGSERVGDSRYHVPLDFLSPMPRNLSFSLLARILEVPPLIRNGCLAEDQLDLAARCDCWLQMVVRHGRHRKQTSFSSFVIVTAPMLDMRVGTHLHPLAHLLIQRVCSCLNQCAIQLKELMENIFVFISGFEDWIWRGFVTPPKTPPHPKISPLTIKNR